MQQKPRFFSAVKNNFTNALELLTTTRINVVGGTKKLEPKLRPHHCIRFRFARRHNEAVFQRALCTRLQCDAGFWRVCGHWMFLTKIFAIRSSPSDLATVDAEP